MYLSQKKLEENYGEKNLRELLELNKCNSIQQLCSKELNDLKLDGLNLEDYKNKYVWFIEDDKFYNSVKEVYKKYKKNLKDAMTKGEFYRNNVDPIKFLFDKKCTGIDSLKLIENEIMRQRDKSNTNFIGTLHEDLLGSIEGFEKKAVGQGEGYDVISKNGKIKMEVKNKSNTTNNDSSTMVKNKLKKHIEGNPDNISFWVKIIMSNSTLKPLEFNSIKQNSGEAYEVSGDAIYEILTGDKNAFRKLYTGIELALEDCLNENGVIETNSIAMTDSDDILDYLKNKVTAQKKDVNTIIFEENFEKYRGFEKNEIDCMENTLKSIFSNFSIENPEIFIGSKNRYLRTLGISLPCFTKIENLLSEKNIITIDETRSNRKWKICSPDDFEKIDFSELSIEILQKISFKTVREKTKKF